MFLRVGEWDGQNALGQRLQKLSEQLLVVCFSCRGIHVSHHHCIATQESRSEQVAWYLLPRLVQYATLNGLSH